MSREPQPRRRGMPTPGVAVPADRRFRRAEAPAGRRRRRSRVLTVARWLVVTVVLVTTGAAIVGRVLGSDLFQVRDVTVRGQARLSTADVETLLTGIRNENVLLVDFERYRDQVKASPWVEQVTLSRVLPATIAVDIVERTPVAVARRNQHLYLVDRTGNIIDDYRAEHASYDLPIVDGLFGEAADTAEIVDAERMQVTAALLTDLSSRPDLARRLSQVDAANPADILVMIEDDPAWLHLGSTAYIDRLQRYLDVRPALLDRFGTIDYADLKIDGRVYVRGRETPARAATAR